MITRAFKFGALGRVLVMAGLFCSSPLQAQPFEFGDGVAFDFSEPFDIDTDHGALNVVAVTGFPVILGHVSETAGDATLVYRYGVLTTNAWFDATAPYHPTAVGVYSRLGRRPASESTNRNINTAVLYSSLRVLSSFLPAHERTWREMLINVGLDPDDNSTDTTTAVGLGNLAGAAVVAGRLRDGMNEVGDVGREYHFRPYADYTRYRPVNTAEKLLDPSRWQPDVQLKGLGLYKIQKFVTPQYALVEPYSYADPERFHAPPPSSSNYENRRAYRRQADKVLHASANLTDEQKMKAEFFDNKLLSLANAAVFNAMYIRNVSLLEFIQFDFLINVAAFDGGIFIWNEKYKYDAVRPFSAIRKLYKKRRVDAWGGPGKGTVRLPGREWTSYIEEADHPEYPSATACFCHAQAQATRRFFGDDDMTYPLPITVGSSRIEPGITPAEEFELSYDSWSHFASECGQSRVWGGVHFQAAVDESTALCPTFGDLAYEYLTTLIEGSAAPRGASQGRPVSSLPGR